MILGTQCKDRAGWPKRLRLVQASPWADFAVITAELWSTMTAIFSWVNNFAFNYYLWPRSWDHCQIFKTSDLFLLNAGLFPFALSEMLWDTCISEYLHKDSNLEASSRRCEQFFRKLTHHPYFDGHLRPISANLGRDTNHNFTKLVFILQAFLSAPFFVWGFSSQEFVGAWPGLTSALFAVQWQLADVNRALPSQATSSKKGRTWQDAQTWDLGQCKLLKANF